MARRTKQEAMKTRESILAAALEVLSEKGYSSMTFVDIAEKIDLTKGAVYWHFKNKETMLVELIKYFHERREMLVKNNVQELKTLDDLKGHFVQRSKVVMQDPLCRKFAFFMAFQMEWTKDLFACSQDCLDKLRESLFTQVHNVLTSAQEGGQIKNDVDTKEVAVILISLWKGLFAHDVGGCMPMDLPKCVSSGFDAVIAGIKT